MNTTITDCINNKVLVETKSHDMEIICSKKGISFLKQDDYSIICSDNFEDNTSSCHLLDYDEIYVNFMRQEYVTHFSNYRYFLSFIYCTKNKKGDTLAITFDVEDFNATEQPVQKMSKKELENFLYDTSNCLGKYIFEMRKGICYASSVPDTYTMDHNFIDLSSKGIVDEFNEFNNFINKVFHQIFEQPPKPDIKTIYDVEAFTLTCHCGITGTIIYPYLITILDDSIKISEIKINFISKNLFEVESRDRVISKDKIHNLLVKNKIKSQKAWSDALWKLA